MYKTTNKSGNAERGGKGCSSTTSDHLLPWIEFFRALDNMDNARILLLESNKTAEQ